MERHPVSALPHVPYAPYAFPAQGESGGSVGEDKAVTAARSLARAEAMGVRFLLAPDGHVQMHAEVPPPGNVLADLRQHRDGVVGILAARQTKAAEALESGLGLNQADTNRAAPQSSSGSAALSAGDRPLPSSLQCLPSWSDARRVPPPGAWCGCCGRFERRGGRWWREREAPTGWCCWTCHPPVHLDQHAVVECRT